MQEQEKSLNSLSIIEDELWLPCSTYEDFQNLNVKLEDVQVKAAVIRLLLRCTRLTPENTTTAMLQAVFSSNVDVECNWEGRGDKQGVVRTSEQTFLLDIHICPETVRFRGTGC
ncbi:hypothetical protein FQA39_LY13412 [Lamprigera yunnana]|nr:hypothetical protein FQA39_LY13412 [Lamprigera yunnana]